MFPNLDRPGPPEGPLEVADLNAKGCKLRWRPPKEDGNSPVTSYVIEAQKGKGGPWKKIGTSKVPNFDVTCNLGSKARKMNLHKCAAIHVGQRFGREWRVYVQSSCSKRYGRIGSIDQ